MINSARAVGFDASVSIYVGDMLPSFSVTNSSHLFAAAQIVHEGARPAGEHRKKAERVPIKLVAKYVAGGAMALPTSAPSSVSPAHYCPSSAS